MGHWFFLQRWHYLYTPKPKMKQNNLSSPHSLELSSSSHHGVSGSLSKVKILPLPSLLSRFQVVSAYWTQMHSPEQLHTFASWNRMQLLRCIQDSLSGESLIALIPLWRWASCYDSQAGLERLGSSNAPTSAPESLGLYACTTTHSSIFLVEGGTSFVLVFVALGALPHSFIPSLRVLLLDVPLPCISDISTYLR